MVESDRLMSLGSEFKSLCAQQLKTQAPTVLLLELGMVGGPAEFEWREHIQGESCRGRWGQDCGKSDRCLFSYWIRYCSGIRTGVKWSV